jgi:hypothetical protein
MRQGGLADAGNVLDQQVSTGEQAGNAESDLAILAEHHLVQLGDGG